MKKLFFATLVLLLAAVCLSSRSPAHAAGYPDKPIRIIVVRKAGGSADIVARMYAPFLQKAIGTNVVVENIVGGSGRIGLSQAFRATPDGYTLVIANLPSYVLTQHIEGGVDYVMSDFESVVGVSGKEGNVLIVPGDSPFNSVQDVIDADTRNPGSLNMAVTSGLSNSSLAQAMFLDKTGITPVAIPYDDGNAVVTAIMGKHVDVGVCSAVAAYGPFASKAVKVLCSFGNTIDDNLVGVPTFSSVYGEEFAYDVTMGLLAPPNVPADILKILRDAAYKGAQDPEFARTVGKSFTVVPQTAEEFSQSIAKNYKLADSSRELLLKLLDE